VKEKLEKLYSEEEFRKDGHKIIDLMADYLKEAREGTSLPVLKWLTPDEQYSFWKDYGEKEKNLPELFKDIIDHSIHLHHPKYMGHQVSAPAPATALAAMVSSLMNNGMAIYEMGPVGSALEKWVAEQLIAAAGFSKSASGFLTSGGTLATLTALLAARQIQSGKTVWEDGLNEKYCILVPELSHYCVDRSARIMGFGAEGIVKVPVDRNFQMRIDLLEECLNMAESDGKKVIAVVANACSTATGTYDDLNAISSFCKKHSLWFHVDAAHGGGAIFSEKYKHLLNGASEADSVIIDLHKMLMNPALSTLVIFKNGNHSYQTFNQKAEYLWAQQDEEWFNYAKRTFECTKLMMSLKFFTLIQQYGFEIFDQNVTTLYDLSKSFAKLIKNRPEFELANEPMANILCFRVVDREDKEALNKLNRQIRQSILEEGEFYIVQTELNGNVYLRVTLMNPFTTEKQLEELLDTLANKAARLKTYTTF